MNLGRTLRFYSDRYGSTMSNEVCLPPPCSVRPTDSLHQQILLHTLNENGIASPASLETYVHDDIDRYGVKLTTLHSKLEKARSEQLEGISNKVSSSDAETSVYSFHSAFSVEADS